MRSTELSIHLALSSILGGPEIDKWEAVSDSAKKTTVSPGIARLGSAVAAGFAQFTFIRKSALTPGDTVIVADRIAPFEPLTPGEYKLHLFLFSLLRD